MKIVFYLSAVGRSPVEQFIESLGSETRYELLVLLRRLENGEQLPLPHARSLASIEHGLYELRTRDAAGQIRVFYYTKIMGCIFLVHALRKKSRSIGGRDKKLILSRIRDLQHRYGV